jgi:DNA-3-methyladenine glycosylase
VTALGAAFFARPAREVAPDLLGCTLVAGAAAGVVVEVERYEQHDAASHSHRGPTPRAAIMFGRAGRLYVYRSYGLHWCANVVCDAEGVGAAVLLRALVPTAGLDVMRSRRGERPDRELCAGPGRLCQALGIDAGHNGLDLTAPGAAVAVLPREAPVDVVRDRRIGITRDTDRPWRYLAAGAAAWWSRPLTTAATGAT